MRVWRWWVVTAITGLLSLLLRAAAGDTRLGNTCGANADAEQTCSWLEDCSEAGCSGTCILNVDRVSNAAVINDRQWGAGAWNMCPELALWVKLAQTDVDPASRRLQQASLHMHEGELAHRQLPAMHPRMHDTAANMHVSGAFNGRQLQDASDAEAPAVATYAVECPSDDIIDDSAAQLLQSSTELESAVQEFIERGAVSADAPGWTRRYSHSNPTGNLAAVIPTFPNEILTLIEYLQDPLKLKEYFATYCEDREVLMEDFAGATATVPLQIDSTSVPGTAEIQLCLDKGVVTEQYFEGLRGMETNCQPLFGSSCYSGDA